MSKLSYNPFSLTDTGDAEPIVVEARVQGLPSAKISIPTSVDAGTHSVLKTAEKYSRSAVLGFN